jgi:hypothetical protein
MSNQELTKFEFLLTLENNIICQRYFNVKNFNKESLDSLDLYYEVKNISDEISHDLKLKTLEFMGQNEDIFHDLDVSENEENEPKENFLLEIKMGEKVFIQRIFDANVFHPKVRYTVDIRPKLKRYLSDLVQVLSSKELEKNYLNYQL